MSSLSLLLCFSFSTLLILPVWNLLILDSFKKLPNLTLNYSRKSLQQEEILIKMSIAKTYSRTQIKRIKGIKISRAILRKLYTIVWKLQEFNIFLQLYWASLNTYLELVHCFLNLFLRISFKSILKLCCSTFSFLSSSNLSSLNVFLWKRDFSVELN